ncbi:MAG TPA: trypsin-like peptidase domain-containing protein [Spirochaetota bacterium]|jgi:S1-C subfamily serine protease|nr:MAG: putative serine protease HhoB precursor [Spirochaetes bacterium ADurb.Bin133]HPY86682.1 trypsin-like peptidase domain-containing protein [Spirochaetota bacterium]HQB60720.1 trypsin-like peptidase domain-containing protein [Spirochaetota bacterium]
MNRAVSACILIVTIFLLFSCKSSSKGEGNEPHFAYGIENIKHNLDKKKIDIFEAYVLSNKILSKNGAKDSADEVGKYVEDLKGIIQAEIKRNYDEKKYDDALRYALSLNTLNTEPEIEIGDIYRELMNRYDLSADFFNQMNLKYEMADKKLLPVEKVYEILKYSYEKKSKGFFAADFEKYSTLYPELLTKYPELLSYKSELLSLNELNFEKILGSVVEVLLDKGMNVKDGMGFIDKSIGTGFFISADGYILTNHHVIADHVDPKYEGYSAVYVVTKEDPDLEIPATVVGYDKVFDIALLKISRNNAPTLTLGRSLDVNLGDKIYAIGNPIGIKNTVTSGIISNKEISFFQLGRAFQIDAAVNPGNSGGPLIDSAGQVIGIVFAGVPQYAGISFAIPFQWVSKAIPRLFNGGEVKRCWIGAGILNENNRVKVYYVMPNGSAEKAGFAPGEVIRSIDGVKVSTVEDAQEQLAWKRYPMLINIETELNGVVNNRIARLEERPYLPVITAFENDVQRKLITLIYGVELEYYDKNIFSRKYKVQKVYKGSIGAQAGILEDTPIVIYDLKYVEKQKYIALTASYKSKDSSLIERVVTIPAYVEINNIL